MKRRKEKGMEKRDGWRDEGREEEDKEKEGRGSVGVDENRGREE